MSESHSFSADAGVIARLGRELVGRQETALTELVKNAYDADATQVDVLLETQGSRATALVITDNGTGMSKEELVRGFLRIASNAKVEQPRSTIFGRKRAGRKGIGRFATERLGSSLELVTQVEDDAPGLKLDINWDDFAAGRELSSVQVAVSGAPARARGTSLRIEGLRDGWTDAQLRRCLMNLSGILQPFPVAPVAGDRHADPGFDVQFRRGGELLEDTVIADLQSQIQVHATAIIDARVDAKGLAEWRITKNKFGPDRDWSAIYHASGPVQRYEHLRSAQMRAYYFVLSAETLPALVFSRIRALLGEFGGVRLYRNGFRVAPYGDPDDDWLNLNNLYARRSETLAPVANRNFFGVVEIQDSDGTHFEERTSREGLVDTPEFEELRRLLPTVLISAVNTIAADRGRIGSPASRQTKSKPTAGGIVERSIEKLASLIVNVEARPHPPSKAIVESLREIEQDLVQGEQALVQEAEMLRFLASIGLASSEFTHEIRMTFQAFGLDMDAIIEFARNASKENEAVAEAAARADSARERVEAFTGYFSEAMASRNLRTRTPVSLKLAVLDFVRGVKPITDRQDIIVSSRVPDLDPLFTAPIHEAELSSILLNLLTNSIKAIKRNGGKREILIEAKRESNKRLALRFSDSGDGVAEELREQIFEPFVTTQTAAPAIASELRHAIGTGLGLWILSQIIEKLGGEVAVVDPATGFATTFEILLPDEEAENG
ncbi:ATP-binding protein [Bosea sp. 2KB_26]|uniref:ATP-binding protein n=1 Tax=Bosea sp. 2KB_26 TaxID=3237475 RepID=UPI003F8E70C9